MQALSRPSGRLLVAAALLLLAGPAHAGQCDVDGR